MTDRDFLHNIKLHLSGGKGANLSHECLARLIGLAERGMSTMIYWTKQHDPNSFTPTTDLRIPAASNPDESLD